MIPDKIYLAFDGEFVAQSATHKTDLNGNSIFLAQYVPHEYIRKDALLEWVKSMKRICQGAEPIEKAYQTIIDKLNSM